MNIQNAFPKVAMWSVHSLPSDIKRLTAVIHMIYFLWKKMCI